VSRRTGEHLALVTQADAVGRLAAICVKAPPLIRNRAGEQVPNPIFPRYERAAAAQMRLAAEFGLSQAERTRLNTRTVDPYDTASTLCSDLLSPAGYDPRDPHRNRDLLG
jgi:phage terminase small subunit